MLIRASVGNAPKSASLKDRVYKLTLTAQTPTELKWLAGLFEAVVKAAPETILYDHVPKLSIHEEPDRDPILKGPKP